jgi:hypothetical protein
LDDHSVVLNDGEKDLKSARTCLLKLPKNNGEESAVLHPVVSKPGRVLIFEHDIYHVGEELTEGTKLCVRTDGMYNT